MSAGGIKGAFPEVVAAGSRGAVLPRWQIIAFRQRKDMPMIRYVVKSIERDFVFFDYTIAGDQIDLTIFMQGLANASADETTAIKTIGYLLLDATAGEYDVETKIAGIEFLDANSRLEKRIYAR